MIPAIVQSALDPAGTPAARIEYLWWAMFWVCAGVWMLVMAGLALALVRGRAGRDTRVPERRLVAAVGAATAVSVIILFGLLTVSVVTGRATARPAGDPALVIQIVGHQWWWDVEYVHDDPSLRVRTANELHLPVGRPIAIHLKSADVIHSFWVPSLHGKTDLVPGRLNTTWLRVDRPGVYRGQCGEYCGLQHAHMALTVVAESPEAFERWLIAQRELPQQPSDPAQARGKALFESGPCALCHTIGGALARGRTGPDLTHFGSRSTLGAGRAANTRPNLERWLASPQDLKPGTRMPPTGLSPDEVQALAAYLEALR